MFDMRHIVNRAFNDAFFEESIFLNVTRCTAVTFSVASQNTHLFTFLLLIPSLLNVDCPDRLGEVEEEWYRPSAVKAGRPFPSFNKLYGDVVGEDPW